MIPKVDTVRKKPALGLDPEDHAPSTSWSGMTIRTKVITLERIGRADHGR